MRLMNLMPSWILLQSEDPFKFFRQGLADVLITILGIISAVSLIVVAIHISKGDREAAGKFSKWLIASTVGLILLTIIKNL